jgi:hypothetical protein
MKTKSPFAITGPRLIEREYCALPVAPGTKRPSTFKRNEWVGITGWCEEYTRRLPTNLEIEWWSGLPDAGVGIVCGPASKNVVGIDIDTDDKEITSAIRFALPHAYLIKRGQKGSTIFFRGRSIEKSKSWNINKQRVCDLIGPGRFTVLPPTIHPDTGRPYKWAIDALENTYSDELPELTPQDIAAIDEALWPFGYEPEPEYGPLPPAGANSYDDLPVCRRLNNAALDNLGAWVPNLNLYRCRRTHHGYEAVATWRASNTGRPIENRKLNLKMSPRGIMDFGDGPRGYTALDLVKAARGCELDAAFSFLSDALGWSDNHVDLPLTKRRA